MKKKKNKIDVTPKWSDVTGIVAMLLRSEKIESRREGIKHLIAMAELADKYNGVTNGPIRKNRSVKHPKNKRAVQKKR